MPIKNHTLKQPICFDSTDIQMTPILSLVYELILLHYTISVMVVIYAFKPSWFFTFSALESISSSAILAHFCQKFGSSKEMSVRFPEDTKLAWNW